MPTFSSPSHSTYQKVSQISEIRAEFFPVAYSIDEKERLKISLRNIIPLGRYLANGRTDGHDDLYISIFFKNDRDKLKAI